MLEKAITTASSRKDERLGKGILLSKVAGRKVKTFVTAFIFLTFTWFAASCTKEEALGDAAGVPYPEPVQQLDYAGIGLLPEEVLNPFDSLGAEPDSTSSSIVQDDLINP